MNYKFWGVSSTIYRGKVTKFEAKPLKAMILFTIAKNNLNIDAPHIILVASEAAKLLEQIEDVLSGRRENAPQYLYEMLMPMSCPDFKQWYSMTNDRRMWARWIVMMEINCECNWETPLTEETLYAATLSCGMRCKHVSFYCKRCRDVKEQCQFCGSDIVLFKDLCSNL